MANLTVLAAFFLALIVGASAYTTVVTSTITDDENPRQSSCRREMQQMMPMRHCMQYMQSTEGPYGGSFLRSAVANPQRYEEEHLEECCSELRNFSPQCRCDAIRQMMMQAQKQYGMEEEQMMRQKAQSLPRMCNMRYPTECRFSAA